MGYFGFSVCLILLSYLLCVLVLTICWLYVLLSVLVMGNGLLAIVLSNFYQSSKRSKVKKVNQHTDMLIHRIYMSNLCITD